MIKKCKVKKFRRMKNGYTLIETMIAVSLFIVIVMEGMGALLNASLLSSKSQNMRSIVDNLSFVMEDMARNIRTGYNDRCFVTGENIPTSLASLISTASCKSGWAIAFEPASGNPMTGCPGSCQYNADQWVYYISSGKIYKATAGPYVNTAFVQLTPDEVTISGASSFSVLGAEPPYPPTNDHQQPLVIIRLVGSITLRGITTPFSLQTTVSQRSIDI